MGWRWTRKTPDVKTRPDPTRATERMLPTFTAPVFHCLSIHKPNSPLWPGDLTTQGRGAVRPAFSPLA